MFGLSPVHILLVVVVGFLIFGVGGSKKLFRKSADRVKDTGAGIKGAAQELQTSFNEEANTDSAIYQATVAGKEKAQAVGNSALDAAKEARDGVASLADDAKSSATGAEPQTAVGDGTRGATDGVTNEEHEPQSALGKAAKSAGDAAKSRVDMLGDTATAFKEGVEGQPAPAADEAAALPAADAAPAAEAPSAPPADQA